MGDKLKKDKKKKRPVFDYDKEGDIRRIEEWEDLADAPSEFLKSPAGQRLKESLRQRGKGPGYDKEGDIRRIEEWEDLANTPAELMNSSAAKKLKESLKHKGRGPRYDKEGDRKRLQQWKDLANAPLEYMRTPENSKKLEEWKALGRGDFRKAYRMAPEGASGSYTMGEDGEIRHFRSPTTHPLREGEQAPPTDPETRLSDKDRIAAMLKGHFGKMPKWESIDLSSMYKDLDAMKAELGEKEKSNWEDEVAQTREWAQEAKGTLDKRELTEKLVQAIGQLAAGWYGMKHNMDMSGLEFNQTDWEAKLRDVRGQEASKLSEVDKREAQRERLRSRVEQLKGRITGAETGESRAERQAKFNQEMEKWRQEGKMLLDVKAKMEGGSIKASDVRALKEDKQAMAKEFRAAYEDYKENQDWKAAKARLNALPAEYKKDPVVRLAMEEAEETFTNHGDVGAGLLQVSELLDRSAAGLGTLERETANIPNLGTIKVKSSKSGKIIEINQADLDRARQVDPNLTIVE